MKKAHPVQKKFRHRMGFWIGKMGKDVFDLQNALNAEIDRHNEINEKAGLPHLAARICLGGSDTAYTTIAGIPCVDCLGVEGKGHHSVEEYIVMSTLASSAKQQAAIALMI